MEERFPMTSLTQTSLRRAAALALAPLLGSLLILSGCATPGGPNAPPPTTTTTAAAATPKADSTGQTPAASPQPAATVAQSAPEVAVAPVPIDPIRPDVPLNLDDRAAQVDLWARVRQGFAMPDLDNDLVRNREQWYATRPDYVQRMTERGSRYMFYIVEELDHRGMPTELALLPFIESAFNPQAMSTAKASGMWQFIPSTGKDFDLKQNIFRDDRRDVLASTRAALDYLQKLYGMFGDWHLALAAYNWGEGSVTRAIARNQKLGLPTDYASLKMPTETQYYVPKLQAVKNIIARPADFGLTLPAVSNHPYFLSVPIEHDIDVALASRLAGLPLDEFQTLNPQMNKPVILAAGTPQVLLPYDNADRFVRSLPQHRGQLATWTAWVVPKTMRPADAAQQVGMTESQLREVNRIPARMLIKSGSTLLVPRIENRHVDVAAAVADNATMALTPDVPPLRKTSLRAGKRDSVASVARRYHVSPAQVAQWNGVAASANFKAGQTVVVYTAASAKVAGAKHSTRRTAAAPRAASKATRVAASPARKSSSKSGTRTAAKPHIRLARN
ncbi:transglycosylase SLT domain-containing protein [soil metagenome]